MHRPDWMRVVAQNGVTVSQYERELAQSEREIARLRSQIERVSAENTALSQNLKAAIGIIEDNWIVSRISAIKLERWLKEHVLPKLRTQQDASWFEHFFLMMETLLT